MLSIFYVPFCTMAIPAVMLTRRIGPKYTIPGYMFGWGTMALVNAACTNFAGVVVIRLCECGEIDHPDTQCLALSKRVSSRLFWSF